MTIYLIRKYLSGNCTAEEQRQVEAYLADDSADQSLLEEALMISWKEDVEEGDDEMKRDIHQQLQQHIQYQYGKQPLTNRVEQYTPAINRKWWYAVAAAILVAATTTVLFLDQGNKQQLVPVVLAAGPAETIINEGQEVKLILLPDSTRVWMLPNTKLSYSPVSYRNDRLTKLEGEAFFDVVKDAAHPFRIESGAVITKVLGTAFNVEAYPKEPVVKVSLVHGKVTLEYMDTVSHSMHAIDTLQPGQMASCDRSSYAVTRESFKPGNMEDWIKGHVVFQQVPVADALQRIAARFRLHIVPDKDMQLDNKRITAIFREASPEQMLDNILFIADRTWRRNGNTIEVIKVNQ